MYNISKQCPIGMIVLLPVIVRDKTAEYGCMTSDVLELSECIDHLDILVSN